MNPNSQAPLRQIATEVVLAVTAMDMRDANAQTAAIADRLRAPVRAMAEAQIVTNDPEPLLSTVGQVLDVAEELAADVSRATANDHERELWDLLDELDQIYGEIYGEGSPDQH